MLCFCYSINHPLTLAYCCSERGSVVLWRNMWDMCLWRSYSLEYKYPTTKPEYLNKTIITHLKNVFKHKIWPQKTFWSNNVMVILYLMWLVSFIEEAEMVSIALQFYFHSIYRLICVVKYQLFPQKILHPVWLIRVAVISSKLARIPICLPR